MLLIFHEVSEGHFGVCFVLVTGGYISYMQLANYACYIFVDCTGYRVWLLMEV
jgi:hypothetical protein